MRWKTCQFLGVVLSFKNHRVLSLSASRWCISSLVSLMGVCSWLTVCVYRCCSCVPVSSGAVKWSACLRSIRSWRPLRVEESGMVPHTSNPSTWDKEGGRSLWVQDVYTVYIVSSRPGLHKWSCLNPCHSTKRIWIAERRIYCSSKQPWFSWHYYLP